MLSRALSFALLPLCLFAGFSSNTFAQHTGSVLSAAVDLPTRPSRRSVDVPSVQIVPSRMPSGSDASESGAGYWKAEGYDLRSLVAMVYDVDPRRVDLPTSLSASGTRYDVSLQMPAAESGSSAKLDQASQAEVDRSVEAMRRIVQKALAQQLGVAVVPVERSMAVYVLTAPNGAGTALHRHDPLAEAALEAAAEGPKIVQVSQAEDVHGVQTISYTSKVCPNLATGGLTVSAASLPEFAGTLEPGLDRPLLDETRLTGDFDFDVPAYSSRDELFQQLHDRLGLVVTPAQRNVTVLEVQVEMQMRPAR